MAKLILSLLFLSALLGCGGGADSGSSGAGPTPTPQPVILTCPSGITPQNQVVLTNNLPASVIDITVDAGTTAGFNISPVWRDHYDLSYTHLRYDNEVGLRETLNQLAPRSWRTSVGRWEIGMPPPTGATSDDPATLQQVEREFYRGENTLAAADVVANYNFSYLDAQLDALITQGVEPFLSFDYMPYVLALVQNTTNSANEFKAQGAEYSFSNGIRTSPPSDPAVYARVIRNMIRHVIGKFPAGGRDYGVKYFEIGNEPEFTFFWGGTRQQWITMYNAIASEVILDADLAAIKLGGGSFALPVSEILDEQNMINNTFLRDFIEDVNTNSTRLDFLSYHSYNNNAQFHADAMSYVNTLVAAYSPSTEIINGEWGLDLNNGLDVIYETIEHGLFRSKVVMSMQIFGPTYAHESLLRDPYTSSCTTGQLGLIQTGPPKGKPAYDVYRGLNLINNTLVGLPIVNTAGTYVMAGKDQTDSKVVIIFIAEDPGSPRNVNLTVNNIPWAGGTVSRYEVSEATHAAQQGVAQMDNAIIVGSNYAKQVSYDKPQLMIWELIKP